KRYPQKLRQENFWIYELTSDKTVQIEEQLEKMVNIIVEKKELIKKLSSCDIDIFCGYFTSNGQGGICIESKIMAKLAELNIHLIFDIHATEEK
ncbi:MAG: DUF4279 domain-containing protein, partial [Candidatus Omnitrophica bacterium]|nr:DUF4279 domain-containing protein [Candidatus Omnitrophota bacterium]